MQPWFQHKRRGIGVTPASPQGWALTGLFVAALIGGRLLLDSSGRGVDGEFVIAMGALVLGFAAVVWRTTGPRP